MTPKDYLDSGYDHLCGRRIFGFFSYGKKNRGLLKKIIVDLEMTWETDSKVKVKVIFCSPPATFFKMIS